MAPGNKGMRSVIEASLDGCSFAGLLCDANSKAEHGWFVARSTHGHCWQCGGSNALIDGFHLARYQDETGLPFSLDDTKHFEDCWAVSHGRVFASNGAVGEGIGNKTMVGAVSTIEGSTRISFSGTDFAVLAAWLRYGDRIAIETGDGAWPPPGAMYLRAAGLAIDAPSCQITVGAPARAIARRPAAPRTSTRTSTPTASPLCSSPARTASP